VIFSSERHNTDNKTLQTATVSKTATNSRTETAADHADGTVMRRTSSNFLGLFYAGFI